MDLSSVFLWYNWACLIFQNYSANPLPCRKKLAQKKSAKRAAPKGGQPQRGLRAEQTDPFEDDKVGNQGHLSRNHQGSQEGHKNLVTETKLQHGKNKAGHATGEHLSHDDQQGNFGAVEEKPPNG